MDLPMGNDLYESFIHYQSRVIEELDSLAREFRFETLDVTQPVDEVSDELFRRVSALLENRPSETETEIVRPQERTF